MLPALECVAGHPDPAFHQHPRAAAHDGFFHAPFAVDLGRLGADSQRARRMAETHRVRAPPPAARLTSVPGMAAAVPIATAAVPIIAWCSLPIESARTCRSMSAAATCLPLDDT